MLPHGEPSECSERAALATRLSPQPDITDPRMLRAFAHPLRLRILNVLRRQDASPKEIADELGVPLANVSYHVRHLAQLGLARLVREVPRRGAVQHYYRAETPPLEQIVGAAVGARGFSRKGAQASRLSLQLDDQGWRAIGSELSALAQRVRDIQEESDSRRMTRSDGSRPIGAELVMLLFEAVHGGGAGGSGRPRFQRATREDSRGPRASDVDLAS